MPTNASAFEAREHWRRVLGPALGDARLPTDRSRPPRMLLARDRLPLDIRGPLFERIIAVCGGGDFLLYAVVLGALAVCLRQHGGARRLAIGSPLRRGDGDEVEGEHLLPIVVELDPRAPFRAVLVALRQTLLDAYANQQLDPLELLDELGRERADNRHPLFDVVLRLDGLHAAIPRAEHDLEIDLRRTPAGLEGELRYRPALWQRESIEALAARIEANLAGLLDDVERPISAIDGLPAAEREALLADAEGPTRALDSGLVHELVFARAAETPAAPAILRRGPRGFEPARSYAELTRRARRIASGLVGAGVGPGAIVAVVGRRSVELIDSLLGALAAGAAYLPLDPDGPARRLAAMIEGAAPAAALILDDAPPLRAELERRGAAIVEAGEGEGEGETELPASLAEPELPAYLLFTSGSTGAPKGVLVPHRGVVNYLDWAAATYGFSPEVPSPVHGAIDTDLGVTSLWGPLTRGAAVVLVESAPGIEPLASALRGPPLGVVKLTPTHLAALSYGSSGEGEQTPPRCLVIGGESLRASLTELWQRHDAPGEIYNEYGPTEAVVGSTAHRVDGRRRDSGLVPIGRPIANARVYLLSEDLRLVPRGATGEVYIGGAGLSHGYLGDPALTADRFIPDPFAREPGQRLYRTGDFARDLGGGELEFRGRRDDQLGVRGYRVELGEVEAGLSRLAAVREAVAVARTVAQRTEITAYLVPDGALGSLSALRRELRQWLTDAMMPTHFVVLDALPRGASGKLDRSALPQPGRGPRDAAASEPEAAGVDPVVATLAEIWARVLGLPDVGPEDNFFDLGGDSILSVHVVAEARHAGLHVLLNDLFQYPTIAELAPRVSVEQEVEAPATATGVALAMLPMQRWWLASRPAQPAHFNQSLVLALEPGVELARIEHALAALVARHEALRVAFVEREGEWVQELPEQAVGPRLAVVDVGALAGPSRREVVARTASEWQRSIDLGAGELVRAVVFLGVEDRPRLLLILHHLVADAATWSILLTDLARALVQPERELPGSLAPWRWAEALAERVAAGQLRAASAFAEDHGASALAEPPAPTAAPSEPAQVERCERASSVELGRRLIDELPGSYPIRLDELILAAWARALGEWTGRETVTIARELHGRESLDSGLDLSRAVGWFASLSPLVIAPGSEPDELLADVRVAVRNPPEGGVGFLAEAVARPELGLPRAPFLFNHLGRIGGGGAGSGERGGAPASPFEIVDGERGVEHSPANVLPQAVILDSMVTGDHLRFVWRWRRDRVERAAIDDLIGRFEAQLDALATHCLSGAAPRYRPEDFELAQLDQAALDAIEAGLEGD